MNAITRPTDTLEASDPKKQRAREYDSGLFLTWAGCTPREVREPLKATHLLHDLGQSLWLDNITRELLDSGTLKRYIDELSLTGLTSNPTIFDHAIKNSTAYDSALRDWLGRGKSGEALFFAVALEDITRGAHLSRPVYDRTDGVDGWVSLEVSPPCWRMIPLAL